jgi:hypothetical protein
MSRHFTASFQNHLVWEHVIKACNRCQRFRGHSHLAKSNKAPVSKTLRTFGVNFSFHRDVFLESCTLFLIHQRMALSFMAPNIKVLTTTILQRSIYIRCYEHRSDQIPSPRPIIYIAKQANLYQFTWLHQFSIYKFYNMGHRDWVSVHIYIVEPSPSSEPNLLAEPLYLHDRTPSLRGRMIEYQSI